MIIWSVWCDVVVVQEELPTEELCRGVHPAARGSGCAASLSLSQSAVSPGTASSSGLSDYNCQTMRSCITTVWRWRGWTRYFNTPPSPSLFLPLLSSSLLADSLSLSLCSHPLTRAALPPVPTGVHETPGARCAMVTRYLLMLEDISGMS